MGSGPRTSAFVVPFICLRRKPLSLILKFQVVQTHHVAVLDAPVLQLLVHPRVPQAALEPVPALVVAEVHVGHELPWLRQLMANVNFGDYESRNWFERRLRDAGVYQQLEDMGIQDGDVVCLYNLEFEYQH